MEIKTRIKANNKLITLLVLCISLFACNNNSSTKNTSNTETTLNEENKQEGLSDNDLQVVTNFIELIKAGEKTKISDLVAYPLKREHPIPDVNNKEEFLNRYHEIFDAELEKIIMESNPNENWAAVGWRGIILNSGDLWLDYDGSLIAVNYQSKFEQNLKEKLIEEEKGSLHSSLEEFERPTHILETEKFKVRIDDLGNDNYRYASWDIDALMSSKPDLIIENGEIIFDGSGGNHRYIFKNGEYEYVCSIILMGSDESPPARLTIYKDDIEILTAPATILKN